MPECTELMKGMQFRWIDPDERVTRFAARLRTAGLRTVLDLGCGGGRHTIFLARQGFTVFALDNALNALQTTRQGLQAGSHSARLTGGDVGDLPYADASFDAIVSLFVIHHNRLARIRRAVEEMCRVLKPGGLAVLDLNSTVSWNLGSETGIEVEPGTFMPTAGNEMGTPHRYFDEGAAREVFSCLHTLDFYLNEQDFRDSTGVIRHYGQWTAVVTR